MAALAPSVLDTGGIPAVDDLGAFGGLSFGRAIDIVPLIIPVNILAYVLMRRAYRSGCSMTAAVFTQPGHTAAVAGARGTAD